MSIAQQDSLSVRFWNNYKKQQKKGCNVTTFLAKNSHNVLFRTHLLIMGVKGNKKYKFYLNLS